MPKLNRSLVTSIIGDIRECVCVANEIYSWLGKIEHLSWKYPRKTAKDINAMEIVEEHKGTAGEFYILLLELAYDRIQFVLRLIVEFMDTYPYGEDFFKQVSRIERPTQMSLASVLRQIWNRLKTIPESISQQLNAAVEKGNIREKVSRSSQAKSNVNYCESCSVAGEAILQVINAIEAIFQENELISTAASERNHSKDVIYERTQWSLMSRLTQAISVDVNTIFKIMRENNLNLDALKKNYEIEMQNLRADSSRKDKLIKTLESKNDKLRGTLENVNKRLREAQSGKLLVEEKIQSLKEALMKMQEKFAYLADGNNILQSQVGVVTESKLELENTVSRLETEVVISRHAFYEAEQNFRLLLTESKNGHHLLKAEYEKRIEELKAEMSVMIEGHKERTRNSAKLKIDKNIQTANERDPKEGLQEETVLMPGDDPEVDMTRQMISNRHKIEILSRQNERLSKTLRRLREYRLTTNCPNN